MVILRAIREPIAGSPFDLRKQMPIPAAAIIAASAISAAGSIGSSAMSNSAASNLNASNREWQEEMYKKYSSPEAMMRQYREAGVNPYLAGGAGNLQGSFSPSNTQAMPDIKDVGSAAAQGLSAGAQSAMVSSQISDTKAAAFMKVAQGISMYLEKGSPEMAESFLNQMLPELQAQGFEMSQATQMFQQQINSYKFTNDILEIQSKWQKDHGYEANSTQLMALNQSISKMVGEMNLLQTQSDLNRVSAMELGSRIGRNLAESLKLHEEAGYYKANAETANQIRGYLLDQMCLQNGQMARQFQILGVQYGNEEAAAKLKREISQNPWIQYGQAILDGVGKVVHVGVGFNWSNTKGMMQSVSNVTSNSNSNVNVQSTQIPYNQTYIPIGGFQP